MADRNYPIRMTGSAFGPDELVLLGARIEEGINVLTRIDIEFMKPEKGSYDLKKMLGTVVTVESDLADGGTRHFAGHCVAANYLGTTVGGEHFQAELRPWTWLLSRTSDCRIFQEKTVPDLIKEIFREHGFSDFEDRLTGTYPNREYIVQYRETDLNFVTRLAGELGIYFFVTHASGKATLVLGDDYSSHAPFPGHETIEYRQRTGKDRYQKEHFHDWNDTLRVRTGHVTLDDYDFDRPSADLKAKRSNPAGHEQDGFEFYDYPGKYKEAADGERIFATSLLAAEQSEHNTVTAVGPVSGAAAGALFTLEKHPRSKANAEYLITRAQHRLRVSEQDVELLGGIGLELEDFGDFGSGVHCITSIEAVPSDILYRPRPLGRKPVIGSIQTATVVGKSGEEIWTDKYGRVKVQFHWDREGKKDENSSCWVRVSQPWAGKKFGFQSIPRIGWEVVVQFEEGDPDRPLITGALYNAENMPPYDLPANATQTGLKTNSSKGGGGFNELMFEDKKGSELVRFQSQKNYREIIKNNAEITVGLETKDKGDMSLTVQNDLSETLKEGNHTFKVEKGEQKIEIKKNQDQKIDGDQIEAIKGDRTQKITGKKDTKVDGAEYSVNVSKGKMTIKAAQKITLQCGGSKIEMTPTGIVIKSMQIQVDAAMTLKTKGGLQATHEAGVQNVIKGGFVMIN